MSKTGETEADLEQYQLCPKFVRWLPFPATLAGASCYGSPCIEYDDDSDNEPKRIPALLPKYLLMES